MQIQICGVSLVINPDAQLEATSPCRRGAVSEISIPIQTRRERRCNVASADLTESTSGQEPVLLWVSGVGFHFHHGVTRQGKNVVQTLRRGKRCKREKEIRQKMATGKKSVDSSPVKPVDKTF